MKASRVKGKDSGRWQKAVIGILLALIMLLSVFSLLTHSTSGSDVTQPTIRKGYIVNPDNVTISMDGNTTSVLIGQNVQFLCDGNMTGTVTAIGVEGTPAEGHVVTSDSTGWLDTGGMMEGLYNATYGEYWELLAVAKPVIDLRLKAGTKEVSSICSGTPLRADFMSNLDENDCVDLKVIDPDGSVIKIINNQKFDDINVSQLLEYGSMNESKQINTTGWEVGTYTFSVRTEEENARGLDVSSNTRTLTILKAEVDIEAEKSSVVELEKVRLAVTGAPKHNITINSSDPAHTIFPAGYEDNLPYDTSGFNHTIDEDGQRRYVVYFNDTGTYTITVKDTTAGLSDTVDISVSEKRVNFDVPATVVIGEKFTIKGVVNAGDTVDIAVEDHVYPELNDILIKADRTFEKEIDTSTADITPFTIPGTVRLDAYIDREEGVGAIGPNETEDGTVAILIVAGTVLNASISKSTVSPGDSFEVYGNASTDYVEIVAISPKGGNGTGLDGLYGVSIYTVPTFNPEETGSYKIHVFIDRTDSVDSTPNRDDNYTFIIIKPEIDIEAETTSPSIKEKVLFTVKSAPYKLFNFSTTYPEDVVMTSYEDNPLGLSAGEVVPMNNKTYVVDVYGEAGKFNATTDVDGTFKFVAYFTESGTFNFRVWYDADTYANATGKEKDDINIDVGKTAVNSFYKRIKVDSEADTGNYTILVLSPGTDRVYGNSSYKYIDSILDLDGAESELGVIDVSNKTQEEIVKVIKNVTIGQAGSDDLLQELHLLVNHPPIASFTYSPENPVVNQNISFNVSTSYDPDGQLVSFQLDFGDGGEVGGTWPVGMIEHAYPSAGNYTVNLTVTDNNGVANSTSKIISVKENLIINGDFSDGLNNWTERGYGRGNRQVEVVYDDALNSSVLEFKRWNSGADGGKEGVYQNLSINVSEYESLYLEADIKVISNTLGDSGWWSDVYGGDGEFPVHIFLYYKDENGTDRVWTHGFLPVKDYWNRRNYDVVNRSEWYHYVSPNLVNVSTTTTKPHNVPIRSPPPKTITGIFLGGKGWDFCGRIDNARLYGEKGAPTPSTIYVPDDYAKIQWAVDNASEGSTIIVRDGTYTENMVVNKRLTIRSENGSAKTIVVNSFHGPEPVFRVTANQVNISGFTVKGLDEFTFGDGIQIRNANYCNISNNILISNERGISIESSSHNTVVNNIVNSNEMEGIMLGNASNSILIDNTINSNGDGIYLPGSSHNTIENNTISLNKRAGIYHWGSSNTKISNNTFEKDGIWLQDGELSYFNTHIIENNMVNGKPVYYYKNTSGIKVPEDAGEVILANCSDMTVENINASSGTVGLVIAYTRTSLISNNIADSNNMDGIYIVSSSDNTIENNNVSNNVAGICFEYSSNNKVYNNNVSMNNGAGIHFLWSSDTNIIYLNNFINNGVYSLGCINFWNSTEEITYSYKGNTYTNYLGNYWSDYTGSDADGDGIGDTPYSIDSDKDNYPLMEPWENYFAATENIFDTGGSENLYPSIMGIHNGTITPNKTITVNRLYTYPCKGTSGHTEYARIWNETWNATATWKGYAGDWHNISFDKTVVLLANETYNYTIRTGSYPQIIHEQNYTTVDGSFINCTKFTDANGKEYNNWIPAIRLWA